MHIQRTNIFSQDNARLFALYYKLLSYNWNILKWWKWNEIEIFPAQWKILFKKLNKNVPWWKLLLERYRKVNDKNESLLMFCQQLHNVSSGTLERALCQPSQQPKIFLYITIESTPSQLVTKPETKLILGRVEQMKIFWGVY